ncbi:hypothetical protein LB543_22015 [Mesorhizobium sp. ESP7-2]|nr:hypothetical protein [Mesorhizobium sp. ESP7-2]
MSGLSMRHVSAGFREMLVCVSNLFPLVNKPTRIVGIARTPNKGSRTTHIVIRPETKVRTPPYERIQAGFETKLQQSADLAA